MAIESRQGMVPRDEEILASLRGIAQRMKNTADDVHRVSRLDVHRKNGLAHLLCGDSANLRRLVDELEKRIARG